MNMISTFPLFWNAPCTNLEHPSKNELILLTWAPVTVSLMNWLYCSSIYKVSVTSWLLLEAFRSPFQEWKSLVRFVSWDLLEWRERMALRSLSCLDLWEMSWYRLEKADLRVRLVFLSRTWVKILEAWRALVSLTLLNNLGSSSSTSTCSDKFVSLPINLRTSFKSFSLPWSL